MKHRLFVISGLFFLFLLLQQGYAQDSDTRNTLEFFFSPSCNSCKAVERTVLAELEKKFGDSLIIEARDVNDLDNYSRVIDLIRQSGAGEQFKVPVISFQGQVLIGADAINNGMQELLAADVSAEQVLFANAPVDLITRFRSFRPIAVAGAGLADGINPCAFTVIVFFISFLTVQGYGKRELICIGSAFIAAVFLTYLLIGLGLFNFLYRLNGFWVVSRLLNAAVGVFSIVLGALSVYDVVSFKRRNSTEGMLLQLPRAVKRRIHSVVGFFYRDTERSDTRQKRPRLVKLTVSALITGVLVSLLEAVCTGQLYLPTIIFVLKISEFKLQAVRYLALYNVMFIVPLVIIFVLALFGATSAQFSRFLRRHLVATKLILAAVFFTLGCMLLKGSL